MNKQRLAALRTILLVSAAGLLNSPTAFGQHTIVTGPPAPLSPFPPAIYGLVFSPDGATVFSCAGHTNSVQQWDWVKRTKVATYAGHKNWVIDLAITADGKKIATASHDRSIRLWNTATAESTQSVFGPPGTVSCLKLSPNGELLATASSTGPVRVWRIATSDGLGRLDKITENALSIEFSPKGDMLAAGTRNGCVVIWDILKQKEVCRLDGHKEQVCALRFSDDGQALFSVSNYDSVRIWDLPMRTSKVVAMDNAGKVRFGTMFRFSPNGKRLAAVGEGGKTILVWEFPSGKAIGRPFRHSAVVSILAFSPDAKVLAIGDEEASITFLKDGELMGGPHKSKLEK